MDDGWKWWKVARLEILGVLIATAIVAAYVKRERARQRRGQRARRRKRSIALALERQQQIEAEQCRRRTPARAAEEERARIERLREEQRLAEESRRATLSDAERMERAFAASYRTPPGCAEAGTLGAPTTTSAPSAAFEAQYAREQARQRAASAPLEFLPPWGWARPPAPRRIRRIGLDAFSTTEHPMARLSLGSDGETLGALRPAGAARGLDERDFEIEEDRHSGISQLLGMAAASSRCGAARPARSASMRRGQVRPGMRRSAPISTSAALPRRHAGAAFRRQPSARSTFTSTSKPTTARPATTPTASHMSVPLLLRRWLPLTTGAT